MNRRELLVAALAAPLLAMPMSALASTSRITWAPGTIRNQHALMVARNLHQLMADKVLYTTGEFSGMGNKITLTDPSFVITPDDTIWHGTRGFRYEDSLSIEIKERGFSLGTTSLYSMADYEAYYDRPKPPEYPDFGVKTIHNPYDHFTPSEKLIRDADWQVVERRPGKVYVTSKEIEDALGRDAIGTDTRWLDRWIAEDKAKKALEVAA